MVVINGGGISQHIYDLPIRESPENGTYRAMGDPLVLKTVAETSSCAIKDSEVFHSEGFPFSNPSFLF